MQLSLPWSTWDRKPPIFIRPLTADEPRQLEADRRAEGRDWAHAEDRRVGRQRTLMAMVPDTRAKDDLKAAMLQRAYDLMWDGDCMACDAVAEFLPSADVEKMFQAWESDQDGQNPRSHFYNAKDLAA